MTGPWVSLRFGCLALAASITVACSIAPQRQALTLSVTPASATAPANRQVQYTAAATYNTPPTSVSPVQATWGVADSTGTALTTAVTIDNNGLAQCTSAASGNYMVGAWIPQYAKPPQVECLATTVYGNPCGDSLLRTAQLTCP
jgi:hypothetical protein